MEQADTAIRETTASATLTSVPHRSSRKSTPPRGPKNTRYRAPSPLQQAVALQRVLMTQSQNPETSPAAVAQIARAWADIEQLKREIKMKPKPKPIDVGTIDRKRSVAGPIYHPDAEPPI